MMMKKVQENPNRYSYRSDDDGSKTVVITDLGKNKLEDIRQEMESLEMEYNMLKRDDDADVQLRLTKINGKINSLRQFAARIRRGDKVKNTWDNQFATNCHSYVLDNAGASVREALDTTAMQMGKTEDFVKDMERRKYPKYELNHLFHVLSHHPIWNDMINYDEIDKSDINTATDLSNQLNKVRRARKRYQWRKDTESKLKEHEVKIKQLEFESNLAKIMEEKYGQNVKPDDFDIVLAWRNTGMSIRQISKQTGISKSRVQRLLQE
jgi:DNA-binding MarR family transcriptional regulator